MKTYWVNRGISLQPFITSAIDGVVVSFTPQPIYSRGKSPPYPLDRKLGGPQSRSGRGGEEKRIPSFPPQELNPGRPARNLFSILTEVIHPPKLVQQMYLFELHNVNIFVKSSRIKKVTWPKNDGLYEVLGLVGRDTSWKWTT